MHPQDGWTGVCRLRVPWLWRPDSCEREEAGGIQTTRRGDLSQEPQRLDAVTLRGVRTYAIGWLGYFALDQVKTTFTNLDKWLRRRVRACYWKQWRKSTTRLKKLISLGVVARAARGSAMSGKGAWRLSKTSSVQSALSIEYLTNEGLLNLEERWRSLASMRRTAQCGPAC